MLETATELAPDQGMLCVLNQEGDTKIIWDRRKPDEVENARRTFRHFVDKKYAAYSVKGKEGEKGEVIREFDSEAERIIFAPPMIGG
jgi:hypothetical protein